MAKHSVKDFDPQRMAAFDMQMLKAYYSHRFLKLIFLLTRCIKEQFGVNLLVALRLAYFSGQAAKVFRKTEDLERTEAYLTKFYILVDDHATEEIDAQQSAKTELHYWLVHRYPKQYDESLVSALSKAKATFHAISAERLKQFAKHYVAATSIRDQATHIDHVEPDWKAMQEHFGLAYTALHEALND